MTSTAKINQWALHLIAPAALIVLGCAASADRYVLYLVTTASIAYILTAGFNIIFGYGGIFNLAYVAVFGLSAFLSVFLEIRFGLSFWLSVIVSSVFASAICVLVAGPTSRLGGIFLAIITLSFALAVAEVTLKWQSFTGGAVGIYMIPRPMLFGEPILNGSLGYYLVCAVGVIFAFELTLRTHRSAMGRRYRALRSNPRTLSSVGASVSRVRILAFATSGFLAGLAGALYAHFQPAISLESFDLHRLIALLLATTLGGAGSLLGPLFGVVALVAMDELSLATGQAHTLIYGVGILVLCALGEGGIAGLIEKFRKAEPKPVELTASPHISVEKLEPAVSLEPSALSAGEVVPEKAELSARNVTVQFGGIVAVNNVNLVVRPGEVVGLIGPNGAGKTTLMNAMTGNVKPTAGSVSLGPVDLAGRLPHEIVRLGVARTFQSPQLVPDITVIDNVKLGFELSRKDFVLDEIFDSPAAQRSDAEAERQALVLLKTFGIADRAKQLASGPPYAVLRLVEIARNLMLKPSYLLLDEPGAGLSTEEHKHLSQLIRMLSSNGLGVLVVDHNLALIRSACDRLIVLDYGTTIAEGRSDDVLKSKEVVAAYLGVPA